ncbi:MAG: micrococcal nuclease [Alphaproteobacteria bacterium]
MVDVSDGDTLDGRQVRLVGIQAPKLPLGRPCFKTWPLGQAAKAALIRLTTNQKLTPHFGGARADRRGIWGLNYYRVIKESEANRYVGTFQLIEGRILKTAVVRGRGYLNFGENWRQDFTITIPKRALNRFRPVYGQRLHQLSGKTVRVRGWLKRYNGPMIEATHPEQIEVLTP